MNTRYHVVRRPAKTRGFGWSVTSALVRGIVVAAAVICWVPARADTLPGEILHATYQPISGEVLEQRRRVFEGELSRLRQWLGSQASGGSWQEYLMCDAVADAVTTFNADKPLKAEKAIETVSQCYYRLSGLHDGIEAEFILAYRTSLGPLRRAMILHRRQAAESVARRQWEEDLEMFPDDETLKDEEPASTAGLFAEKASRLSQLIAEGNLLRDGDRIREVDSVVGWMRKREQMLGLIDRIESRLGRANVDVKVSALALGDMTERPAYEVEPISRNEDGVQINGQAVVSGIARMHPVFGGGAGVCEVQFVGNVVTTLSGSQGPVSFGLTGHTALTAQKPVVLSSHLLSVQPSVAQAHTDLRTDRVCTKFRGAIGGLVRKIASKEIAKERPQASRDMSKESADGFLERFDEDIEEEIAEAQRDLDLEVHRSLRRLDLKPRRFDFVTNPEALRVQLQFGSGVGVPVESGASFAGRYDMNVRLHESMINSICDRLYAGRRIKNFRHVIKVLGIKLSDEKMEEVPEDIGLTFSEDSPIKVQFSDNRVSVQISGDSWQVAGLDLVGMNVKLAYRLENDAGLRKFVLDNQFEISAPLGSASGRFFQQKNVLQRRLEKELPAEIPVESVSVNDLPEMVDKLGNLSFPWIQVQDGWLKAVILGDRMTPVAEPVEFVNY